MPRRPRYRVGRFRPVHPGHVELSRDPGQDLAQLRPRRDVDIHTIGPGLLGRRQHGQQFHGSAGNSRGRLAGRSLLRDRSDGRGIRGAGRHRPRLGDTDIVDGRPDVARELSRRHAERFQEPAMAFPVRGDLQHNAIPLLVRLIIFAAALVLRRRHPRRLELPIVRMLAGSGAGIRRLDRVSQVPRRRTTLLQALKMHQPALFRRAAVSLQPAHGLQ